MEFDEQKAVEIIKKFNLSEKTFRVWKSRNKIPNKYLKEDFKLPEKQSKADALLQQRITEIFKSGKINQSVFLELCGIRKDKYVDVNKGKSNYTPSEIIKIKSELNKLRLEIAKTFEKFSERQFLNLLNNPLLKYSVIIKNIPRSDGYDQISYFKRGKHPNPIWIWERVRDEYIIFAMKLRI